MKHASLAQSVEHRTFNPRVAGSSPAGGFSGTYTAITNSIFNSKIGTEITHRWRSGLTRSTQDRFPSGAQVRTLHDVY